MLVAVAVFLVLNIVMRCLLFMLTLVTLVVVGVVLRLRQWRLRRGGGREGEHRGSTAVALVHPVGCVVHEPFALGAHAC